MKMTMSRCEHGVYDPHGDQKYCSVCNPIPLTPDMVKGTSQSNIGTVGTLKDSKAQRR